MLGVKVGSKFYGLAELQARFLQKTLSLSTRHMPCSKPSDFGSLRHVYHRYGYIVFVGISVAFTRDSNTWLRPIVDLAQQLKCSYINFDADAEVLEGLPTWDW